MFIPEEISVFKTNLEDIYLLIYFGSYIIERLILLDIINQLNLNEP